MGDIGHADGGIVEKFSLRRIFDFVGNLKFDLSISGRNTPLQILPSFTEKENISKSAGQSHLFCRLTVCGIVEFVGLTETPSAGK